MLFPVGYLRLTKVTKLVNLTTQPLTPYTLERHLRLLRFEKRNVRVFLAINIYAFFLFLQSSLNLTLITLFLAFCPYSI